MFNYTRYLSKTQAAIAKIFWRQYYVREDNFRAQGPYSAYADPPGDCLYAGKLPRLRGREDRRRFYRAARAVQGDSRRGLRGQAGHPRPRRPAPARAPVFLPGAGHGPRAARLAEHPHLPRGGEIRRPRLRREGLPHLRGRPGGLPDHPGGGVRDDPPPRDRAADGPH